MFISLMSFIQILVTSSRNSAGDLKISVGTQAFQAPSSIEHNSLMKKAEPRSNNLNKKDLDRYTSPSSS